jgi:molecular chaperone DnaK
MTASQKLGEKMYADAGPGRPAGRRRRGRCRGCRRSRVRAAAKPADDNVVDAEVKEVKKGSPG